ncbi:hypothetical protein P7C73_g3043, partial [Tremellales sp. Uapishka_1]
MHFWWKLATLAIALKVSSASQSTWSSSIEIERANSLASLEAIDHVYTIVDSVAHPDKHIRIKSHKGWCDPAVRSYTGYIDTGYGKKLFFYFFESRSQPEVDPVVMWINGGPGGSSAMGAFMEQGPCRINPSPKTLNDTHVNEYAWNNKANIFFLDQPVGVGFSHAENGQEVFTTEAAARDVAAFIDIFFHHFTEFRGRAFHMTGESYGGRYLPVFASAVFDQNAKLVAKGRDPINLKSVMIGNGGTSLFKLIESSYEFSVDLGRAILDIKNCVTMAETVALCNKNLEKHCVDTADYTACEMWLQYCGRSWSGTAELAGVNWYNVNQTCTPEQRSTDRCLAGSVDMETYLNMTETRAFLGVDGHTPSFKLSNEQVLAGFTSMHDFTHQTYYYVANLLERGIKVLNSKWMAEMRWTGQQGYRAAPTEKWMVDGNTAGTIKTFGDLTLLKLYGAGHLVPTDRPKEALVMFNDWIEKVAH